MKYISDWSNSLRRRPLAVPVAEVEQTESEKHTRETATVRDAHDGSDSDDILQDAQDGVKKMEATTKTWTRGWLIVTYILSALP